jgi:hypothetical protein
LFAEEGVSEHVVKNTYGTGQAGAVEAVEIASTGGETTLVQFRSAALPETLDGILE